jgi:hypothetical protein
VIAGVALRPLCARVRWGVCVCLLGGLSGFAVAQNPPSGWRRPSASQVSSAWRQKSHGKFLVVRGDFDGDGKSDRAELLVNDSANQFALFVRLASSEKWNRISQPFDLSLLGNNGIDLVKPGRYKTACDKGYGDFACAHGEPEFLDLSTAAIDFFQAESSDSIFYWEGATKSFRETLMSD